jgi:hypothetical protein
VGTLRSLGEGGCASEGSALRSVWRGATTVRPWGSTPSSFCIQSAEVHLLFRSNHVLCVAHPCWRPATQTIELSGANPHVRVVPPFVVDRGFETHGLGATDGLQLRARIVNCRFIEVFLAEKGGSRTLRGPYGPQTGFEDQRHHRAPSFSPRMKLTNYQGIAAETNGTGN